ncbi:MAG: hypothetical protein RSB55_07830 [Oscillospiraceae bacterium]
MKHPQKSFLVGLAALALCLVTVGGSLCWMTATGAAQNHLTAGTVSVAVLEDFDGVTKTNVRLQNTGTVTAYLRAALVPTWETAQNVAVAQPVRPDDLAVVYPADSSWFQVGDLWYYALPVPPGGITPPLVTSATAGTPPDPALHLNLQLLSDAIQAQPVDAPAVWVDVQVVDGALVEVVR